MGSTNQPMNNNTKRGKEKKDFSVDNKVPKQQKTTTKADVIDISAGIIDINDTPDVATWNKKIHIKDGATRITVNPLHEAEIPTTTTTSGIGLRDKKGSKKDSIIDPANKKEVDEAIKSGSTLTDEATDLS
jgi:hypothetical protein